jgi:hypothetical protein
MVDCVMKWRGASSPDREADINGLIDRAFLATLWDWLYLLYAECPERR